MKLELIERIHTERYQALKGTGVYEESGNHMAVLNEIIRHAEVEGQIVVKYENTDVVVYRILEKDE